MNQLQHGTSHGVIAANIAQLILDGEEPNAARRLAYREASREALDYAEPTNAESRREIDQYEYLTVRDNPIIRAGVFPYPGSRLPGADPARTYNVYRPLEELSRQATLESFAGLPIIDEHEMLGGKYPRGAEERGVHGATLENIRIAGLDVLAPLRIFSRSLKRLIDSGKKGLSLGYNCRFEKISGVFDGITYDYIQRDIRGNHLALVTQGRNGTEVLDEHDVLDHFDLAIDTGELNMADENKETSEADKPKDGEEKAEMSLAELTAAIKSLMPVIDQVNKLAAAAAGGANPDNALDGDTKDKPGDTAEDEDKDKDGKDKAMDAAEIDKRIQAGVAAGISAFSKNATKTLLGSVAKRDALAKSIAEAGVGTFVFDHMDLEEVALYGAKELGIKADKANAAVVVEAYLAGRTKAAGEKITYAMDSATVAKPQSGGLLAKRVQNGAPKVA